MLASDDDEEAMIILEAISVQPDGAGGLAWSVVGLASARSSGKKSRMMCGMLKEEVQARCYERSIDAAVRAFSAVRSPAARAGPLMRRPAARTTHTPAACLCELVHT